MGWATIQVDVAIAGADDANHLFALVAGVEALAKPTAPETGAVATVHVVQTVVGVTVPAIALPDQKAVVGVPVKTPASTREYGIITVGVNNVANVGADPGVGVDWPIAAEGTPAGPPVTGPVTGAEGENIKLVAILEI
jgi:hypothetical protein